MRPAKELKVFISSTSEDLYTYRAAARDVILEMRWTPVMMEYMGASSEHTVAACKHELEQCDLVLLLCGWRRGWVPTGEQGGNGLDSITALELAHADQRGIPVLAFLANESWPGGQWDHAHIEWIRTFRGSIDRPAVFFDSEGADDEAQRRHPWFRSKVRAELSQYKQRMDERGDDDWTQDLEAATDGLAQGKIIPLLGTGLFGSGPLSGDALARALGDPNDNEQRLLPTAAEYRERRLPSRDAFLDFFLKVLVQQSADPGRLRPTVYDVLCQLNRVKYLVSMTCDLTLEDELRRHDRSPWIITHILRSFDRQHDGKVLVLPPDPSQPAEICMYDKVDLTRRDPVVYKPLGSPLLHQRLDPELRIDTVVATETDHLRLLSHLDNQQTGIPTAFRRILNRYPLLFMGYELDRWHYRLATHVFDAGRNTDVRNLAISRASSAIEMVSWKVLGTTRIPLNYDDFATRVRPAAEVPRSCP